MEHSTKNSQHEQIRPHDFDDNCYSSSPANGGKRGSYTHQDGNHDGYVEESIGVGGGRRSHRSSISSLPGSVVVHPHADTPHGGEDLYSNILSGNDFGSKKNHRPHSFITHVRDRSSPFRHPSSVRAMQMGDEDSELDAISPSSMTLKARKQRAAFRAQSPCVSEMSLPMRSGAASPSSSVKNYYRSPHTRSVQEEVKKEYPLVLLHCNLLPPSLSLPPRLGIPSPELLREVLPDVYWRRWKLLEDKVVGSGVIRDRGVLISHPQEAYDVLEERLLESLELIRPRLAYGHFLGAEDGKDGGGDNSSESESDHVVDAGDGTKCHDCGQKVLKNPEGGERKWEVRVYAANGLMRAGAWAAAWKDMEKVDVEVGLWLPVEVKRELERRMVEEEAFRMEAELRSVEEEKRTKEIYGDPDRPSQEEIDGLIDVLDPEISEEQQSFPQVSPTHHPRDTADFLLKKLRSMDSQALVTHYTRMFLRDPIMMLVGGVILILAIIYGPFRGLSTTPTNSASSFFPNNVVTVTTHHTLPAFTTTVFASASASSNWPHSPIISATTVATNSSISGTPAAVVVAETAAEPSPLSKAALDVQHIEGTSSGRDDGMPSSKLEPPTEEQAESFSAAAPFGPTLEEEDENLESRSQGELVPPM
ncbi:hypothetical protein PRK78_000199 [Emydomyces testavorans]|uniref:Uncharacterized protein n=1 Tax=Emydomyces testavorans TaxID=2070801 RepID=A0AAF0DA87_9EURO|nr:hypothetical protein PRK78_000199 [Emydomyces testavorans]